MTIVLFELNTRGAAPTHSISHRFTARNYPSEWVCSTLFFALSDIIVVVVKGICSENTISTVFVKLSDAVLYWCFLIKMIGKHFLKDFVSMHFALQDYLFSLKYMIFLAYCIREFRYFNFLFLQKT